MKRSVRICAVAGGLLGLSAALSLSGAALAQTAHYPKGQPDIPELSSLPDWDGLWERDQDNVWDNRIPVGQPQVPPYNAEYADLAKNGPPGPRGSAFNSMPGYMSMLFPMEIQVSRMQVTIMSENKPARRIYIDGRDHTEDTLPSSEGHSAGHWDNGALIVDTCCIRDDTRLPGNGPHSDALHITERFYMRDYKTLVDEITVQDPKAFTGSWTTEKVWFRRADWEPIEYDREENDRDRPANAGARNGGE
ncbi:hypothetical protein [Asticcacaulis sp.]|uniref:hypothetical protein n=1 Tax=Asticcacaulis sp. TaxID=1872648 RepID=UPI002C167B6F|nr:hypothetical protein [Asticcacaulis sp.]HTM81598.1 hypothetical protein [Asticcacaulis sp.]